MGDILIEFREVKLCCLDPGFSLLRVTFTEWQSATQPGKDMNVLWVINHAAIKAAPQVNLHQMTQKTIKPEGLNV